MATANAAQPLTERSPGQKLLWPRQGPEARSASHKWSFKRVDRAERLAVSSRVCARILVLPVASLLLMTPVIQTHPGPVEAKVPMALLSLFLVSIRGPYRARPHLSVIKEMPGLPSPRRWCPR